MYKYLPDIVLIIVIIDLAPIETWGSEPDITAVGHTYIQICKNKLKSSVHIYAYQILSYIL